MPFKKIFIHAVWATHRRKPFLNTRELRKIVWDHIRSNARTKQIYLHAVGGYVDHCHCLISMEAAQRLSDIVKLIKGESSHWINEQRLCGEPFRWQESFAAFSVSPWNRRIVTRYIARQEIHHGRNSLIDYIEDPNLLAADLNPPQGDDLNPPQGDDLNPPEGE
jgi:putative transposase